VSASSTAMSRRRSSFTVSPSCSRRPSRSVRLLGLWPGGRGPSLALTDSLQNREIDLVPFAPKLADGVQTRSNFFSAVRSCRSLWPHATGTNGPTGRTGARLSDRPSRGVACGDRGLRPLACEAIGHKASFLQRLQEETSLFEHQAALADSSEFPADSGGLWLQEGGSGPMAGPARGPGPGAARLPSGRASAVSARRTGAWLACEWKRSAQSVAVVAPTPACRSPG
jgi:hypothetical protein